MCKDQEFDRLMQNKAILHFTENQKITDMLTVYYSDYKTSHHYGIYSALIPNHIIDKILLRETWDLHNGEGVPGAIQYYKEEKKVVEYFRFGNDENIEPIVLCRSFEGIREDYVEISEEFRLFHKLYYDSKTNQYIKFSNSGQETVVVTIEDHHVKIRIKEIRQFLAIKDMHLSIQFDYREHSQFTLEELAISKNLIQNKNNFFCWILNFGDFGFSSQNSSFSRLLGKRLITPLPKYKSGFWGFEEEPKKEYLDFIIDIDDEGNEIIHSSNPDTLADNFGGNREEPHYLTTVYFNKKVLDRYYQQPSKYSVEDSYLSCCSLWGIQIDNHHDDKVCVWLGDLGRDLPFEEQHHWRSYNILPQGNVSETYFKRQILSQFIDSERIEHVFIQHYQELKVLCDKFLGWQLLIPLSDGDEYHLKSIRIPATNEQRDFDELILALTKILIDSLNEKQLNKLAPNNMDKDLKGSISRLEAIFKSNNLDGAIEHIMFLRKLQELRSSSSAHRKGSNYRKIADFFELEHKALCSVFEGILQKSLQFIDFLSIVVQEGYLKK